MENKKELIENNLKQYENELKILIENKEYKKAIIKIGNIQALEHYLNILDNTK